MMDAKAPSGVLPPVTPRISCSAGVIVRDSEGNALGGIRLSGHHVPTAFNGAGSYGGLFCTLLGVHGPFTAGRLGALYRNHTACIGPRASLRQCSAR